MEERGLFFILFVLAVAFTSVNCSCKSDLRHLKYCLKNNTLVHEAKVCSRVFCKDRHGADKAEEEEILVRPKLNSLGVCGVFLFFGRCVHLWFQVLMSVNS